MTDTQLKYLLSIANTGSFTRTAEQFFVSQPTISSQISQLEKELGFVLLERKKHGAILTDAGHEYVSFIEPIMVQHQRICEVIRGRELATENRLSIGIFDACYSANLFDAIRQVRESEENAKITVEISPIDTLYDRFTQGEYDVIVAPTDFVNTDQFFVQTIDNIPLVLYYNNSDKIAQVHYPSLNDFENIPIIVAETDRKGSAQIAAVVATLFIRNGLPSPPIIRVSNDKTIAAAVRSGMGIGLDTIDQPELLRGDFRMYPLDLYCSISAVWRDLQSSPYLKEFLNTLKYNTIEKQQNYF